MPSPSGWVVGGRGKVLVPRRWKCNGRKPIRGTLRFAPATHRAASPSRCGGLVEPRMIPGPSPTQGSPRMSPRL